MPTGKITCILRTASGALPINNSSITVYDEGGNRVFYEFLNSANSGLSKEITLESPPKVLSLESDTLGTPYSVYRILLRAEGNYRMEINGIQIFEDSRSILPIELIPLPSGVTDPDSAEIIRIFIPEHILRQSPPSNPAIQSLEAAVPAVNIEAGVYIPETITVHLGAPDEEAYNVTVAFTDYIKNVASSEVYPTWPEESLRANIIAQISLSLNRIYTEWYRSRGYNFDITNATAYDQAFVYGRNIFDEMSVIVDEIFNNYLVRPNRVEPLFASYCDGTTTTCAGLSQWGTVSLAEGGRNYDEILTFYYGDVEITETDDIRSPEESYPGAPLESGDSGSNVRIIQEQLNRIAINFPALPLIEVNSSYDEATERTVREFQRLFILPITGITDRATWYRISRVYAAVKRLSELTSEGQRASYNNQIYPGEPLRRSSRGSEVQEIQFYLQRISRFNPIVEPIDVDGVFGISTERSVISFQNAYSLEPTGIVAENDWNRLVEIYNGTLDNVDEPIDVIPSVPYPGTPITQGMSGEYVLQVQRLLNVINNVFVNITELDEDGIYGSNTVRAVNEFSAIFGFAQNGSVDAEKWNKLDIIYRTVISNCVFESDESEGALPYPGAELNIGASGDNVSYIQTRINYIYTALPYIGELVVDGRYGTATRNSISALQRIFGLTDSGITNSDTWALINYIYSAVERGCIPRDEANLPTIAKTVTIAPTVREIKEAMKRKGLKVGFGNGFGLISRTALYDFQKKNGLYPSGLPDSKTVEILFRKD